MYSAKVLCKHYQMCLSLQFYGWKGRKQTDVPFYMAQYRR